MFNRGSPNVPVNVGEEIDVRIEAVGEKGDGIAKKKGYVLFVPNAKEGEEVRVKVTRVLRRVGFAEVVGPAQGAPEGDSSEDSQAEEPAEDSEDFGEDSEVPVEEDSEEPADDSEDFGEDSEEPADEAAEEEDSAEEDSEEEKQE